MKRFFLLMLALITIIITVVSCKDGEQTVRVPIFLVNKTVAKKFPIEKNLIFARALLENPKVSFKDDRLIMLLDYKASLMGEKLEGKTTVSSRVSYKSETKEVYLVDLRIEEIKDSNGKNLEQSGLYDNLNELLSNYIATKPVYELEEKYKNYEILGIKIEKGNIYVTVKK